MSNRRRIRTGEHTRRYEVVGIRPHDAANDVVELCPSRDGTHGDHLAVHGIGG